MNKRDRLMDEAEFELREILSVQFKSSKWSTLVESISLCITILRKVEEKKPLTIREATMKSIMMDINSKYDLTYGEWVMTLVPY